MKTIEQINRKLKAGDAVVLTASEVKKLAKTDTAKEIAKRVDVVTTATFSPMCSSGVFLNVGHTTPPMKMQSVKLDGVPAYGGIAAVDVFLGAAQENPDSPRFGGAHVIHKLVKGDSVRLEAHGRPTDCYPRDSIIGSISLDTINQAYFYNPRNCYQNYNAATNSSAETLRTYMGVLSPNLSNVNYSSTGEISPLINDPELRTIGVGTPLFCCGGIGYVAWEGTQFNANQEKDPAKGLPIGPAATLAIVADLRDMKPEYIRPMVVPGYGITISIALGFAIPVLDENLARDVTVRNKDIKTRLVDYATGEVIKQVDYEELIDGKVELDGKKVPTKTMTDIKASEDITHLLKKWVVSGKFELNPYVLKLPKFGKVSKFKQDN